MTGRALVVRADALRIPLPDASVDLIVTSPPYFALRSYRDGDEHYTGQIGSEPTPQAFLEALWAVMAECWRVLKPSGSCFINLGDKRSGSGGHNNATISKHGTGASTLMHDGRMTPRPDTRRQVTIRAEMEAQAKATRRNAPDRYNQAAFGRAKSKMLLPHRFAEGCMDGLASPCQCPEVGGYRCPPGMHRADKTCVLHGRCRPAWIMRSDIVWQKLNGLPESVTDRVRDSHEYLFHFTKEPRYFAAVDEVREPHQTPVSADGRFLDLYGRPKEEKTRSKPDGHHTASSASGVPNGFAVHANPLGKLPGSVWALPSEPLIISDEVKAHYNLPDHFAAFPTELVRRVILGWSPSAICTACGEGRRPVVAKERIPVRPNFDGTRGLLPKAHIPGQTPQHDRMGNIEATITGYSCSCGTPAPPTRSSVILDPFGGTGTTAGVARALGRIGVSVDLSADYSRLADYMIHRSNRFAKVVNRTNRENQGSLL